MGSPHHDVTGYGASGDGSQDDASSIQSAIDAADPGGVVYFPPGTYRCDSGFLVSKPLTIAGAGVGSTTIRFTHDGNGFSFSLDSKMDLLEVRDLTISTETANTGTAIDATWPNFSSSSETHSRMRNLVLRGSVSTSNSGWLNGIRLQNGWNSVINAVNVRSSTGRDGSGIVLDDQCIDTVIRDLYVTNYDVGVNIDTNCEGVDVTDCTFVPVNIGVNVKDGSGQPPLLFVTNSHANSFQYGVRCRHRSEAYIAGNLFYRTDDSDSYAGVKVDYGDDVRIVNNCVIPLSLAGPTNGIIVTNTDRAVVTGNQFREVDTGVWLTDTASYSIAAHNT